MTNPRSPNYWDAIQEAQRQAQQREQEQTQQQTQPQQPQQPQNQQSTTQVQYDPYAPGGFIPPPPEPTTPTQPTTPTTPTTPTPSISDVENPENIERMQQQYEQEQKDKQGIVAPQETTTKGGMTQEQQKEYDKAVAGITEAKTLVQPTPDTKPVYSPDGQKVTINGVEYGIDKPLAGDYRYYDSASGGLVAGVYVPVELGEGMNLVSNATNELVAEIVKRTGASYDDVAALLKVYVNNPELAIMEWEFGKPSDDVIKARTLVNRHPELIRLLGDKVPGDVWKDFKNGIPFVATDEITDNQGNFTGKYQQSVVLLGFDESEKLGALSPSEQFYALKDKGIYPTSWEFLSYKDTNGNDVGTIWQRTRANEIAGTQLSRLGIITAKGELDVDKLANSDIEYRTIQDAGLNLSNQDFNRIKLAPKYSDYLIIGDDGQPYYDFARIHEATLRGEISPADNNLFFGKEYFDAIIEANKQVKQVLEDSAKEFEDTVIPNLPEDLQKEYSDSKESGDITKFQASFESYVDEQNRKYQEYLNAKKVLEDGGYEIKEDYYGVKPATPITPEQLSKLDISTAQEVQKQYDIVKYLQDNTENYKIKPNAIALTYALYGEDTAKKITDAVQTELDYLNSTINHLKNDTLDGSEVISLQQALRNVIGYSVEPKDWWMPAEVMQKRIEESSELQKLLDKASSVSGKENQEVVLKEILGMLTDEQIDKVADIFSNDIYRHSPFAQMVNAYNQVFEEVPGGKFAKLSVFLTPFGMPFTAAEAVANIVSPYTVSNATIAKQINDNYKYFDESDEITFEAEDYLTKALKNNKIEAGDNPLATFKNLTNEQKQKIAQDYTRDQLGLSPSAWDKVLTGLMVASAALTKVPLNKFIGKWGTVGVHSGIAGAFIAGSVPTILSPNVKWDDKAVAIMFDLMMAKGMFGGITAKTTPKTETKVPEVETKPAEIPLKNVLPEIETAVNKVVGEVAKPTGRQTVVSASGAVGYDLANALRNIKNLPDATLRGTSYTIITVSDNLAKAIEFIKTNAVNMNDATMRFISKSIIDVTDNLNRIKEYAVSGQLTDDLARSLSKTLVEANDALTKAVDNAKGFVDNATGEVLKTTSKTLIDTSEAIKSTAESIKSTAGKVDTSIRNTVSKGILDAETAINNTLQSIGDGTVKLASDTKTTLTNELNEIKTALTDMKDYVASGELTDDVLRGISEKIVQASDAMGKAYQTVASRASELSGDIARTTSKALIDAQEAVDGAIKGLQDKASKLTDTAIRDLSKKMLDAEQSLNNLGRQIETVSKGVKDNVVEFTTKELQDIQNALKDYYKYIESGEIKEDVLRGLSKTLVEANDAYNRAIDVLRTKTTEIRDNTIKNVSLKLVQTSDLMNSTAGKLKAMPVNVRDATLRNLSKSIVETTDAINKYQQYIRENVKDLSDRTIRELSKELVDIESKLNEIREYITKGQLTDDVLLKAYDVINKGADVVNYSKDMVVGLSKGAWEYGTGVLPENIVSGIRSGYYKVLDILKENVTEFKDSFRDGMSGKPREYTYIEALRERGTQFKRLAEVSGALSEKQPTTKDKPKNIEDYAKEADKAYDEMVFAKEAFDKELESGALAKPETANNLLEAIQKSKVADKKFIDELSNIESITSNELKRLEKLSGYEGLQKAITDVSETRIALDNAWNSIRELESTPSALNNLKMARVRFIDAVSKFNEATSTRIKPQVATGYDELLKQSDANIKDFSELSMRSRELEFDNIVNPNQTKTMSEWVRDLFEYESKKATRERALKELEAEFSGDFREIDILNKLEQFKEPSKTGLNDQQLERIARSRSYYSMEEPRISTTDKITFRQFRDYLDQALKNEVETLRAYEYSRSQGLPPPEISGYGMSFGGGGTKGVTPEKPLTPQDIARQAKQTELQQESFRRYQQGMGDRGISTILESPESNMPKNMVATLEQPTQGVFDLNLEPIYRQPPSLLAENAIRNKINILVVDSRGGMFLFNVSPRLIPDITRLGGYIKIIPLNPQEAEKLKDAGLVQEFIVPSIKTGIELPKKSEMPDIIGSTMSSVSEISVIQPSQTEVQFTEKVIPEGQSVEFTTPTTEEKTPTVKEFEGAGGGTIIETENPDEVILQFSKQEVTPMTPQRRISEIANTVARNLIFAKVAQKELAEEQIEEIVRQAERTEEFEKLLEDIQKYLEEEKEAELEEEIKKQIEKIIEESEKKVTGGTPTEMPDVAIPQITPEIIEQPIREIVKEAEQSDIGVSIGISELTKKILGAEVMDNYRVVSGGDILTGYKISTQGEPFKYQELAEKLKNIPYVETSYLTNILSRTQSKENEATQTRQEFGIQTRAKDKISEAISESIKDITAPAISPEQGTETQPEPATGTQTATETETELEETPKQKEKIKEEIKIPTEFVPPEEKIKEEIPPKIPLKGIISAKDRNGNEVQLAVPEGSAVWIQGRPMFKGGTYAPMLKILVPPYGDDDLYSSREIPEGYMDEGYKGKGSARKSLQIIGGELTSPAENVDLGWARINIRVSNGKPVIEYVQDEDANTGERSQTIGQGEGQIPIEVWREAKKQGISKEELVSNPEKVMEIEQSQADEKLLSPKGIEDGTDYESLYNELVNKANEIGYEVKMVGYDKLKDYSAMNPHFAKTIGIPMSDNEILINNEWNKDYATRYQTLRHELEELDDLQSGKPYWEAHNEALATEHKTDLSNIEMPKPIKRVTRITKPKNFKNWYDSPVYDNVETPVNVVKSKKHIDKSIYYLGHKILSPDVGGEV